MRKLLPFLLLLGACAPDIAQNPPPGPAVVVEFDPGSMPPVVPAPNDLAINPTTHKIQIPITTGESAAQAEFNQNYLGTLDGFPFESTITVPVSGRLDPATVNDSNVVVLDVTDGITTGSVVPGLVPTFDASKKAVVVPPPAGGWTRKHRYAGALIAGPIGRLHGPNGEPVIGSPTWALVSSATPLVDCPMVGGAPNFASPDCKPAVDVIPSTLTDPAAKLADQTQKAISLEGLRLGYASVLGGVAAVEGLNDVRDIVILWTFTIVDAGEVAFDPGSGVIPFPNDVLRPGGTVTLPNPKTGKQLAASDCASSTDSTVLLTCGLNTLDGFSTIAFPVSNQTPGGAVDTLEQATLDPMTSGLTTQSVGLVSLSTKAPSAEHTTLQYQPCLNCLTSAAPQQLAWSLQAPLDEQTTYLAYLTGDIVDTKGIGIIASPAFALVRSQNPLVDAVGKSQVDVLTDMQASQLEPLRAALKSTLDGFEQRGLSRSNLALAWAFTTQSEATQLDSLYAYVGNPALMGLPQGVVVFADATAQYQAEAAALMIPINAVAKFYVGSFVTPVAVTAASGAFDLTNPRPSPVTFALAIPISPMPATGYPISIFGHGITRDHNDFLALANALATAGQAVIAPDHLFHGERSSCTGVGAYLGALSGAKTDDTTQACADPTTMKCNEDPIIGRCVAQNDAARIPCPGLGIAGGPDPTGNLGCNAAKLGACASDGKCEGGDFLRDASGRPVISGWNIFSLTNFFATRDNLRQSVIDLAQLVSVLKVAGATSLPSRIAALGGTATFDLTKIGYVGQSLGGILGTISNSVSPDTTNVVLNVPGGNLPQIILHAASFSAQNAALLKSLAMLTPSIKPNTVQYDQFINTVQWVLDPADPSNMAWRLTHPVVSMGTKAPNRKAFIQFIVDDQTIPNVYSTLPLVAAAARSTFQMGIVPGLGCTGLLSCYEFTDTGDGFDMTTAPPPQRHGFLLQPPTAQALALTAKAQLQVATFLATGMLP